MIITKHVSQELLDQYSGFTSFWDANWKDLITSFESSDFRKVKLYYKEKNVQIKAKKQEARTLALNTLPHKYASREAFRNTEDFQEAEKLGITSIIMKELKQKDVATKEQEKQDRVQERVDNSKLKKYLEIMKTCSSQKEFTSKYPRERKSVATMAPEIYREWKSKTPRAQFDTEDIFKRMYKKEHILGTELLHVRTNPDLREYGLYLVMFRGESIRRSLVAAMMNTPLDFPSMMAMNLTTELSLRGIIFRLVKDGTLVNQGALRDGLWALTPKAREVFEKVLLWDKESSAE